MTLLLFGMPFSPVSGQMATTLKMLPAHPTPSPPHQPRGEDCLLCSGLPTSVPGDVSAPALHGLPSASLTDSVLQALLQGSSKSWVTVFCGRLGAEFTSSQRDLSNPRVWGEGGRSAQHQPEGGETDFPDESRSWDLQMQVKREVCVCAGEGE